MGGDADCHEQVARGSAAWRGLALAAEANRLAVVDAGRNLDGQHLHVTAAAGAADAKTHLAARHGRTKRNLDLMPHVGARLSPAGAAAAAGRGAAEVKCAAPGELPEQ